MSTAELAASLAAIDNPADLLQAFSSLSQEGLATLNNFAAFQEGAKRQRVEEPPQPQLFESHGLPGANELGAGQFPAYPQGWHQPPEMHNHGAQHYQQHQ